MKTVQDLPILSGPAPFPLRSETDYRRAVREIEPLAVRSRLTRREKDFLEVMTILIEHYEDEHHRIETTEKSGCDLLKHLLEENGLSGADLGRILGTRTEGYPILRGERELTKTQMRKLGEYFGVPAGMFL